MVYILGKNARERVCFCAESVLLDDNFLRANFQQFCLKEGTFWQDLQGKQHVFYQKIAREKVSFSKKLQEKGYSCGDRVGTPVYKN